MYFIKSTENGKTTITGPYLISARELLVANDQAEASQQLTTDEAYLLSNHDEMVGIYSGYLLDENTEFVLRETISTIEYRALFQKNSEAGFDIDTWKGLLGITSNAHKNLLSGRSKPSILQSRQIANMCISHSHMNELSALFLNLLYIGDVKVETCSEVEFGKISLKALHTLRKSNSLSMNYYWSQRSHIEVCQLWEYIQKVNQKGYFAEDAQWMNSPEWSAMTTQVLRETKGAKGRKVTSKLAVDTLEYLNLLRDHMNLSQDQLDGLVALARRLSARLIDPVDGAVDDQVSILDTMRQLSGVTEYSMMRNNIHSEAGKAASHSIDASEKDEDLSSPPHQRFSIILD